MKNGENMGTFYCIYPSYCVGPSYCVPSQEPGTPVFFPAQFLISDFSVLSPAWCSVTQGLAEVTGWVGVKLNMGN